MKYRVKILFLFQGTVMKPGEIVDLPPGNVRTRKALKSGWISLAVVPKRRVRNVEPKEKADNAGKADERAGDADSGNAKGTENV